LFPPLSKHSLASLCVLFLSLAISSQATAQSVPGQPDKVPQPGELGSPFPVDHFWDHLALEFSGGYTPVVNKGNGLFGDGFIATAGVIDHLSSHWNLMAEMQIFGLKGANYTPNPSTATFAFDVAGAYDILSRARTSPYFVAGAGYYYMPAGIVCSGVCSSISGSGAAGYNGGAGVRHRLYADRHMEIFAEGRYHYIASGSTDFGQLSLLPISAGIRW